MHMTWELFVGGMIVGGFLAYSICDLIFPIMKDDDNEND